MICYWEQRGVAVYDMVELGVTVRGVGWTTLPSHVGVGGFGRYY